MDLILNSLPLCTLALLSCDPKWAGIIIGFVGDFEGNKEKIKNAYIMRDHFVVSMPTLVLYNLSTTDTVYCTTCLQQSLCTVQLVYSSHRLPYNLQVTVLYTASTLP